MKLVSKVEEYWSKLNIHLAAWLVIYLLVLGLLHFLTTRDESELSQDLMFAAVLVASWVVVVSGVFYVADHAQTAAVRVAVGAVFVIAAASLCHLALTQFGFGQSLLQDLVNYSIVALVALAIRGAARGRMSLRAKNLAEQRALSAQLAPHSLFNMLNVIYDATQTDPDRAGVLVLSLSDMMRHLTEFAQHDYTVAGKEWRFIEAYAEFAVERLAGTPRLKLQFTGDPDEQIPAMICVTLFENAVKHTIAAHQIDIDAAMFAQGGRFEFTVTNRMPTSATPVAGLGTGHDAVRRRLTHCHPGRHSFQVYTHNDRYHVAIAGW